MEGILRTGFVKANGFAQKARRVAFAIAKAKGIDFSEVVPEVAQLNQYLFKKLQEIGVQKNDVVRIEVPFQTNPFKFDLENVRIEVYRLSGVFE